MISPEIDMLPMPTTKLENPALSPLGVSFLLFDHPDNLRLGETAFPHSSAPSSWADSTSQRENFRGQVITNNNGVDDSSCETLFLRLGDVSAPT